MSDSVFVVRRWQRYGHDRLYVATQRGEQLGWVDARSQVAHPAAPEHGAALREAVAGWTEAVQHELTAARPPHHQLSPELWTAEGLAPVSPAVTAAADSSPELAHLTSVAHEAQLDASCFVDLADQIPGQAVRDQADSLREAAPVATFFARLVGLRTQERAWRIGADGEKLVAAKLARLMQRDPRWRVLHSIRVGLRGADIDHLVIGPGGVFTLNAKHHPSAVLWVGGDTFMVNGQRVPYVRKSRDEARRAARLLSAVAGMPVTVQGVIVPVRARSVTVKTPPTDVSVVPRQQLRAWFLRHEPVLEDRVVNQLWEVARQSTTWRSL